MTDSVKTVNAESTAAPDPAAERTGTAIPALPEPPDFPEAHDLLRESDTAHQPAAPSRTAESEPIPHVEHSFSIQSFKCVQCGSKNLVKGMIVDYSDRFDQVRFAPRRINLNWLNSLFNLRPWKALLRLNAIACRDCGTVMTMVDPEELRRAERQRD